MDKELTLRQVQLKLASRLSFIHELCVKRNITYSCAYGTLLGAYREKGSIKWDYDVDLFMYESDLIKLIACKNEWEKYFDIITYLNKTDYYGHSRLVLKDVYKKPLNSEASQMIQIDIFTIDNVANSDKNIVLKNKILKAISNHKRMLDKSKSRNFLVGMIKKPIQFFFGKILIAHFIKKAARYQKKMDKSNEYFTACFVDQFSSICYFYPNAQNYHDRILLSYEDFEVYALANAADFLKCRYGDDFMTPRIENQFPDGYAFTFYEKE